MKKPRPICKFAEVEPDKAGRVVMRKGRIYPCAHPVPETVFPVSITSAYGFRWPPPRRSIDKEDCARCPCWTPREVTP